VRLELAPLDRVPPIWGDHTRLKQIVLNLLTNAVKFTPRGGQVRVAARREGGRVVLTVRDTGIGMSEPEIEIALQPFSQVESAMTRSQDGTGLGLPLTKALTEQHGGRLTIASTPGKGTIVEVALPDASSAEARAAQAASELAIASARRA
jgi:two-component system cell cycle sensor histidine kinase PleC